MDVLVLNPAKHAAPLPFFLAVSRGNLRWLVLNSIFFGLGSISIFVTTYLLGRAVDALQAGGPAAGMLWAAMLALASHEVFYRIGHVFEVLFLSRLRRRTKEALFDHTTGLSFGYFADRFAGQIAHKISSTADAFENITLLLTNGFVEGAVLLVTSLVMLGALHPRYALFLLLWNAYFITGSLLIARRLQEKSSVHAEEEARTTGALVDTYGNIGAVKVYGRDEGRAGVHRQIAAETRAFRALGAWDIITYNFQGTSIVLLSAGLLLITASLYSAGRITVGAIVFISATALQLWDYVDGMGRNLSQLVRYRGECEQNIGDLVAVPEVTDGGRASSAPTVVASRVEYRDVTFAYGAGEPVLRNLSVFIAPGEKVGIVGLSGAGKTTFVNLLLRFFDPQEGAIELDGVDIRHLPQAFLRAHLSHVSQDPSLFHATVAENVAYGLDDVSQERIEHAARLAYADEFIRGLPQGYASVVGERGIKLSGGQRQRIAIARAILADRPLFLLDEATSALDSDSEEKIQRGLATLMERKTVIAVAHRLSTLARMDRILFLERGRVVEDGAHAELLARDGKYARLWRLQAGGFLPEEDASV